jgi:hypothetical protein
MTKAVVSIRRLDDLRLARKLANALGRKLRLPVTDRVVEHIADQLQLFREERQAAVARIELEFEAQLAALKAELQCRDGSVPSHTGRIESARCRVGDAPGQFGEARGYSIRGMAAELEKRKVQTPRDGAWHPHLVKRIVERLDVGTWSHDRLCRGSAGSRFSASLVAPPNEQATAREDQATRQASTVCYISVTTRLLTGSK